MTNQEYFIGQLINDESKRLALAKDIEPDKIFNDDLKTIVIALQEDEFNFLHLLIKYGRNIAILGMELANNSMKRQLNNKGMLWRQSSSY